MLGLLPGTANAVTWTEFPVPGMVNAANDITVGPDGALWFTMPDNNAIGRITTAGVVNQFAVPTTNSAPNTITLGPDGALWFTEAGGNKVARITTGGAVTEFSIPSFGSGPGGIVTGPDGALWFTEYQNAVGRVTTTGAFTEYPSAYGLGDITTGPDGALWFTGGSAVRRITTAGQITTFPAPGSVPTSHIVQGPDGALWYTELSDSKIARITTAGAVTEFPILGPNRYPGGITVGPDGALWFTQKYDFGRMTAAGAVSEYRTPSGAIVSGAIVTGPDNALWGSSTGRILRAAPGDAPAGLPVPVLAKTVAVQPVSGKVFVSVPAGGAFASVSVPGIKGRRFVALTAARELPVGSLLDTRRGTMRLTAASSQAGKVFSGTFSGGVFQALQSRSGLTTLPLKGSSFRTCAARAGRRASAALSRRVIRRMRSNASGRFRTRGRYSAATVRGTVWETIDRCDGTLTKVTRGTVVVRDFRKRRNITVRARKSYLARAPG